MGQGVAGRPRPGGRAERDAPPAPDPVVRAKADKLHASGMPFQMAMAVAQGRLELNEALERLSRKERVNRLMEKHDLSRALATQIVIGHADLDQVLARRRLESHRESHRERTVLVPGAGALTFVCHGGRQIKGAVAAVEPYDVRLAPDGGGDPVEVHKLQIKYAYPSADWKKVKKAVRAEKAAPSVEPVVRPQDRYTCSDRRLFGYLDRKQEVTVTLLEGDELRGEVTWFSRYEFGLKLKTDVEVTVFRHALANISV